MNVKLTVQLNEGGDELEGDDDKPARIAGLAVVLEGRYSGSLAAIVMSSNAASPVENTQKIVDIAICRQSVMQ